MWLLRSTQPLVRELKIFDVVLWEDPSFLAKWMVFLQEATQGEVEYWMRSSLYLPRRRLFSP